MFAILALGPTPPPPAGATGSSVSISGFAFNPQTITVVIGVNNTVTWTNNDATPHTVSSDASLFQSGSLSQHSMFSRTFSQEGTFTYHCAFHPSMTGTVIVIVQASSSGASVSKIFLN